MSPRVWVCLDETIVFVCLLLVLMSCVRSYSGWVRPALSLWCSLGMLPRVSECARAWAMGQAEPFFGMFIVNIICCIAYNIGTIRCAK